jgi:ribosomal protein S27E
LYDEVRGQWEERFERRYGFWRGFVDEQVKRYLDCGLFENGFARVRCPDCRAEYLLAFSCKTRELCPSCAARRAAATAALLREEVLEEVGHAQWVFVMPKMLRPYFLHHRKLLGGLARAAWETVRELMVAATGGEGPRPGMVAVVQTAGDLACGNAEANREPADFALHGSNRLLCGGVFHGNKISKLEVLSSRVTVRKSRDPASVSSKMTGFDREGIRASQAADASRVLPKRRSTLMKIVMLMTPVHSGNAANNSKPLRSTIMPATGDPAASPNHHMASMATAQRPRSSSLAIRPSK